MLPSDLCMSADTCSAAGFSSSFRRDFMKPSKLVSEVPPVDPAVLLSHACQHAVSFHFGGSKLKRNRFLHLPLLSSSPQNRMIKAGVSHLREQQQCYCTFKGEDATLRDDRALIWKCCLLPGWDQRRPGRCVLSCCSEWSDQRGGGEVSWRTDSLGCVCQVFFSLNGARKKVFVTVRIILLVCCA